jgi:hypothetical protein
LSQKSETPGRFEKTRKGKKERFLGLFGVFERKVEKAHRKPWQKIFLSRARAGLFVLL